jgi:phytoene dehydrogenase-like protein
MYGLIVIGDDLSSYIAAAAASSKGIKTALFTENGTGSVSLIGDLAFDADSTPLTGLGENQVCTSLLKDSGIHPETVLLNPAYQIILPEHRLDFFSNKEELVTELMREFPDLAPDIKSFYDASVTLSARVEKWISEHPFIRPESFKDYLNYIKLTPYWVKSIYFSLKLKKMMLQNASFKIVMEAERALLSCKTGSQNSLFSHFRYCTPLRGAYNFSQGKQDFFTYLIKIIETKGGVHLNHYEVLAIKKGKLIEVTCQDKKGDAFKVEADNLIVSTKWQNMRLIIDRRKKFGFGDFIRPAKISRYPFTLHLGVNPRCIPEKMARHVAVISDVDKDIYDNNLIILESGAQEFKSGASKIPLSATVYLPDDEKIWSKENLNQTALSMIERLEYFIPFLADNIEFIDIQDSIELSQKQRNVVNPRYRIRNSFLTRLASKNNKTKFGNIYLTGASLLADIGFEGEIISGLNAASRLTSQRK